MNGKAILIALAAIVLILSIPAPKSYAKAKESIYPNAGIVIELDEPNDLVYFRTFNGQEWCFEGIEDWQIGDYIAVIFSDKGTDTIYDDEIVKVRYIGYAE